jgi:hypothetical protein
MPPLIFLFGALLGHFKTLKILAMKDNKEDFSLSKEKRKRSKCESESSLYFFFFKFTQFFFGLQR